MDRRFKGVLGFVGGLIGGLLMMVLVAAFTNTTHPILVAQAVFQALP